MTGADRLGQGQASEALAFSDKAVRCTELAADNRDAYLPDLSRAQWGAA